MDYQIDVYEVIHRELVQQQFDAIRNKTPHLYEGFEQRITSHLEKGLSSLRAVLRSSGVGDFEFERYMNCVQIDERLHFLYDLPYSATFGRLTGEAMESSLFNMTTARTSEITTLLNLFIRLLDSLVDEAPELYIPERDFILRILQDGNWQDSSAASGLRKFGEKHPIVELTYKVLFEWLRRIRESEAWQSDSSIRYIFSHAVKEAISAELNSLKEQSIRIEQIDIEYYRNALKNKSEYAIWVTALAPICMNGWPNGLDHELYRRSAHLLGQYIGWIDDVRDIMEDIAASRWSNVLLATYERIGCPSCNSVDTLKYLLLSALANDHLVSKIVHIGTNYYDETIQCLESIGVDHSPLLLLMADLTQSWLGTNH